MAGETAMFKFLSPRIRPQSTDIKAAAFWGVAATTTALWVIQIIFQDGIGFGQLTGIEIGLILIWKQTIAA